MKLTKKAAALLLAASLAVSVCATPVFAASNTSSNKGSTAPDATVVTYKVVSSYTWSIPTKIDFGENAGVNNTRKVFADQDKNAESNPATKDSDGTAPKVCVTENIIDVGKTLKISIDTAAAGVTYETAGSNADNFYVQSGSKKLYFTIELPYSGSMSPKKLDNTNSEVLKVPSGTNTGEKALTFKLEADKGGVDVAEMAGTYNGKVAFKSEVGDFT